MSKHTPWTVVDGVADSEMYAVKGVYLVADNLPIEDANLISAAPDLLEALKELMFNARHGNGLEAHYKAHDRADAAIAKAEGRA